MEWNGGCQDSSGFVDIVLCPGFTQGWIQDFPKGGGGGGGGGGANGIAWRMGVAAGRVPLKLLPCVLNVCS